MKRRLTLALALPAIIVVSAVIGAMKAPALINAAAVTPPPPPTFVPTPIGPPPPPPTFTPTPAPPTPTPTPTTAPAVGAPARIVASTRVQRIGNTAVIHWRMAFQLGIKGFRIYANHKLLTRSMIHPHHSPKYTARVPWVRGATYVLQVLYKNGHSQRFPVR